MTDENARPTRDVRQPLPRGPSQPRPSRAGALWLGGAALVLGGLVLMVEAASRGPVPTTPDQAAPDPHAASLADNPRSDVTQPSTARRPAIAPAPRPAAPAPRGHFAPPAETEDDEETSDEAGPAETVSTADDGSLVPAEIVLEAKLAPRAPVSTEPLVPKEIVLEAKLAPRAPVSTDPLVPQVIEIRGELAAPRR